MLARVRCLLIIGFSALSAIGCASEPEAHSCGALTLDGTYDIQFDQLDDCFAPFRKSLPDQFVKSAGDLVVLTKHGASTTFEMTITDCTTSIAISTQDRANRTIVTVFGDDLVGTPGDARGQVTLALTRFDSDAEFDSGRIGIEDTTPLCTTSARASLTLAPDNGTNP